jgi:hypothetical protein
MKLSFKAFKDMLTPKKAENPQMSIDRDEAEFEREIVFNELVKSGLYVIKHDWNMLTGMIENRFSWGAFIGGSDQSHDAWDLAYIDTNEPPPQEPQRMEQLTHEQLLRSLEGLRAFAKKSAKK